MQTHSHTEICKHNVRDSDSRHRIASETVFSFKTLKGPQNITLLLILLFMLNQGFLIWEKNVQEVFKYKNSLFQFSLFFQLSITRGQ